MEDTSGVYVNSPQIERLKTNGRENYANSAMPTKEPTFSTWGNSGIEPDEGSGIEPDEGTGNQLSRNV
jgi:hypothetical protein